MKSLVSGPIATAEELGVRPAPGGTPGNLNPFGVEGPWCACLPHFRLDRVPSLGAEIQAEYLVPRDRAVEAISALRAIGEPIDAVLAMSELRTVAADELWLSPATGRDSLAIHFTFRRDPEGVARVLPEIEARLLPLDARPHWGKLFHAGADMLAGRYPRLADWQNLVAGHDPDGKFANRFLEQHVSGA